MMRSILSTVFFALGAAAAAPVVATWVFGVRVALPFLPAVSLAAVRPAAWLAAAAALVVAGAAVGRAAHTRAARTRGAAAVRAGAP